MLMLSPSAEAQIKTGQQLMERLEDSSAESRIEGMRLVGDILFAWEGKSHCKPPQATVGQAVAITQKFLTENPHLWHYDAPHLVGAALGRVWPCPYKEERK